MEIHKTTIKLNGDFEWVYYTKSFPSKKKLVMRAWYSYADGFEKTEEEFEEFKEHIQYRVNLISVGE